MECHDQHPYNMSVYESNLFSKQSDYVLGLLLVFIGISGAFGNIFSIILLVAHKRLVQLKVTWILFINMAVVDATQLVPTLVCGLLLIYSRVSDRSDFLELWAVRIGGFIMNVAPFVAQLITLVFTMIKVFVYLCPFRSRYALTLKRTVAAIAFCYAVNLALEALLFSANYDFKYDPCTGILKVVVNQNSGMLVYVWIKLLLSLLPFTLTIFGNVLIGVAVYKAHRSKAVLCQDSEMDRGEKRTMVTAFLLIVTNIMGYSLQNSVLFYYLIQYPNSVSKVTKYPAYERIIADLLLPASNAAVNSTVYIFHYLPTLQQARIRMRNEHILQASASKSTLVHNRSSVDTNSRPGTANVTDSRDPLHRSSQFSVYISTDLHNTDPATRLSNNGTSSLPDPDHITLKHYPTPPPKSPRKVQSLKFNSSEADARESESIHIRHSVVTCTIRVR